MHFLAAGFEPEELFGAYIAEDRGKTVWHYPGQKALRYLVPFGKVEDVIAYLRDAASTPTSTPISPRAFGARAARWTSRAAAASNVVTVSGRVRPMGFATFRWHRHGAWRGVRARVRRR
jgi:hypothetical protein